MTKIKNRTILITGGASGIGKLLAIGCFQQGAYRVIIWDVNKEALADTKKELYRKGYDLHCYLVDISDVNQIKETAKKVKKQNGKIDILFNNAGIVIGKSFEDHSHDEIEKTIQINVSGVMHTALEFLPDMMEEREGHIVNIASAAGLIANPNMSVYAASKWAVVGWSESLRLEQENKGTDVVITTILPSYINTGMFNGVSAPLLTPIMEPDFIVQKIFEAVKNNEIMVMEPFMTKTIPFLKGVLPTRAFDFIAGKIFGVYKTMETFQGRKSNQKKQLKENKERI